MRLYIVPGASPSLLNNGMATRRGKRTHLAKQLNTFDDEKMDFDHNVRTLCNLVVYDEEEGNARGYGELEADCANCLKIKEGME